MEGERVEIYDGWFGVMVSEGQVQSLVKVTDAEPSLIGKTLIFMNTNLKKEKNNMTTVTEMTAQYNEIAKTQGLPQIKKFKDKATAEKRLAAVTQKDGTKSKDEVVNKVDEEIERHFTFKKATRNARKDLLKILVRTKNQMSTQALRSDIEGLRWQIREKKSSLVDKKLSQLFEIREEKRDGQVYFGIFEK